jgi:hypothetical protein
MASIAQQGSSGRPHAPAACCRRVLYVAKRRCHQPRERYFRAHDGRPARVGAAQMHVAVGTPTGAAADMRRGKKTDSGRESGDDEMSAAGASAAVFRRRAPQLATSSPTRYVRGRARPHYRSP